MKDRGAWRMTVPLTVPRTMKLQLKVKTDSLHWSQPISVRYFTLNSEMSVINRSTQECLVLFFIYMCCSGHLSPSQLLTSSRSFRNFPEHIQLAHGGPGLISRGLAVRKLLVLHFFSGSSGRVQEEASVWCWYILKIFLASFALLCFTFLKRPRTLH